MALFLLEKMFADLDILRAILHLVVDTLERLPAKDRYQAKVLVTHSLVAASAQFDGLLVFWREYVQSQQSHVKAVVSHNEACQDRQYLDLWVDVIIKDRARLYQVRLTLETNENKHYFHKPEYNLRLLDYCCTKYKL